MLQGGAEVDLGRRWGVYVDVKQVSVNICIALAAGGMIALAAMLWKGNPYLGLVLASAMIFNLGLMAYDARDGVTKQRMIRVWAQALLSLVILAVLVGRAINALAAAGAGWGLPSCSARSRRGTSAACTLSSAPTTLPIAVMS